MNTFIKKITFIVLALLMPLFMHGIALAVNTPKTVVASVTKADGASFPADADILIRVIDANAQTATYTGAPTGGSDPDGIIVYTESLGIIQIQMGNFGVQWVGGDGITTGDEITIAVESGTQGNAGYESGETTAILDDQLLQVYSDYPDTLTIELSASGSCGDGTLDDGESCDEGAANGSTTCGCQTDCAYTSAVTSCDDNLFCNGVETCDGAGACQAGTPVDPDDGVSCTVDSCDEDNDAVVNAPDDGFCNNGEFCDGAETCDATLDCQAGSDPCPPGEFCNDSTDQCQAGPVCTVDADCNDGEFCNGAETCNTATGECQAGTPVDPDDGVTCTVDSCDEDNDAVVNAPDDGLCDNGEFCDGAETCDATLDCQAGTPVDPGDGVGCTVDSCDEVNDVVVNSPDNGLCDDGAFCNGAETCDAVNDCQAGTPVDPDDGVSCTVDSCDEDNDAVVNAPDNGLCDNGEFCDGAETCDAVNDCQAGTPVDPDDGVSCTVDSCDEDNDAVVNAPDDGLCDNGEFCDGAETCDATLDCQAGSDPCPPGEFCNDSNDQCQAGPVCTVDADCDDGEFCNGAETCNTATGECQAGTPVDPDDGVTCTVDSCDEDNDVVVNAPDDGLCDNGEFCDGAETCDATLDCQAGTPVDPGDGVGCTVDSCDEVNDVVVNSPDNGLCDNGEFCDGAETCDATLDCQAGTPVDPGDGVGCTVDSCDEVNDVVVNSPDNGLCDDGAFCNGAETCDAVNDCQAGTPVDPGDGVGCTVDSCDEVNDVVVNAPDDGLCDNGEFCDGAETCDATLDCQAGSDPCPPGEFCNDSTDQCQAGPVCTVDADCNDGEFCNGAETCNTATGECQAGTPVDPDDGVTCTVDSCDEDNDAVVNAPDDGLCDNGEFCDGAETCDATLDCQAGTPVDPDDGVSCTVDSCDEDNDAVVNAPDNGLCDDGAFCNGAETCDAVNDCQAGTDPCAGGNCNDTLDECVACLEDADCDDGAFCNGAETCDAAGACQAGTPVDPDDGVSCTVDSCDEDNDAVVNAPDDGLCDDGAFCNGAETCDATLDCQAGTPVDPDDGVGCTVDSCDEDNDAVVNAPDNGLCDDGAFCNGAETCDAVNDCQAGTPVDPDDGVSCTIDSCDEDNDAVVNAPDNGLCDDGAFCNGAETCDAVNDCQAGTDPCAGGNCNDTLDECVACLEDADCDDGAFCNGAETCDAAGACQAGAPVDPDDGVSCTVDSCDEDNDAVVNAPDNGLCDDGAFCNGAETCDAVNDCQAGTPVDPDDGVSCTVDSCDEDNDAVVNAPDDGLCDDGAFCNGAETCDAVNDCQAGTDPCAGGNCNDTLDECVACLEDADCDDGVFCNGAETCDAAGACQAGTPVDPDDGVSCTVDSCDEDNDAVVNAPDNGLCDDGAFCNGAETCDAVNDCQAGTSVDPDDGVSCTVDSCDEDNDAVVNAPDNGLCDNGAFCDGAETCDAVNDCQAGTPVDPDDGVSCTVDSCDEDNDAVVNAPDDGLCDNGAFCDGAETCDAVNDCQAGTPVDPDDGVSCTVDSCDEDFDTIVNAPDDGLCDDGAFCNGAETCDATNDCQAGTDPCAGGTCNETLNECIDIDADIEVVPLDYDFGNVIFGETSSTIVFIMNTGGSVLTVEDIYLVDSLGAPFAITLNTSLPVAIEPQDSVEVEVTYAPTSLFTLQSDDLVIMSDDPDEGSVSVLLDGMGVLAEPGEASAATDNLIVFVDMSVEYGTLWGVSSSRNGRNSPKKYRALMNMIEETGYLIDTGMIDDACEKLGTIYRLVDGARSPKDLVAGPATDDIAMSILAIQYDIGCSSVNWCPGDGACDIDSLSY